MNFIRKPNLVKSILGYYTMYFHTFVQVAALFGSIEATTGFQRQAQVRRE